MAGENLDVQAQAPQVDTQNMPVGSQLQAPAPTAPVSVASPADASTAVPQVPGSSWRHLAPAMVGAILGHAAGPAPAQYGTDANGKVIALPSQPMSTGDKIRQIANHALVGLGAADTASQEKSGLAKGLSGVGAGAKAVTEQTERQDALKRARAKEDFEAEQQTKLRHYEVMRQNALTMSTYFENKKRANDMTPVFSQNESLFNAVKSSPELGAHAHEMSSEQVEQESQKDPEFMHTHIVKPMGWAPDTDANGNPVMTTNEDGIQEPKFSMRMAVIDGTKDGKMAITPELAADFKKYGAMARIPNADAIQPGQEYELGQIIPLLNKVDEQRKAVLDGWQKAEVGWTTDKDGKQTPVETNKVIPVGDPSRTRPLEAKPIAMREAEAKTDLEKAQAKEAYDKGQEALANANMIARAAIGGNDQNGIPAYMDTIKQLPASSQTILRSVNPSTQLSLLAVATGDAELSKAFPTRTTAKSGQMDASHALNLVKLLNPDWSEQLYGNINSLNKDFTSGPASQQINSFNQFFAHSGQAADVIRNWKTSGSPLVNKSVNWLRANMAGDPQVTNLLASLEPVKDEWLTMVKSGKAADVKETERANEFLNLDLTANALLGNLQTMGHQGVSRIDQVNEQWKTLKHQNYPNLVRESGLDGAKKLGIDSDLQKYNTGGSFRGTAMGQPAPQPALTNLHSDGKVTIGWDGKQWVDSQTRQPYTTGAQ